MLLFWQCKAVPPFLMVFFIFSNGIDNPSQVAEKDLVGKIKKGRTTSRSKSRQPPFPSSHSSKAPFFSSPSLAPSLVFFSPPRCNTSRISNHRFPRSDSSSRTLHSMRSEMQRGNSRGCNGARTCFEALRNTRARNSIR